jgi:NADH:ubiquinone oxidoreductase subunit 4 (subunit M)
MTDQTWVLPLLTFLPLVGAVVMMLLVPKEAESTHKLIALVSSLAAAALGVALFASFNYDASKTCSSSLIRHGFPASAAGSSWGSTGFRCR